MTIQLKRSLEQIFKFLLFVDTVLYNQIDKPQLQSVLIKVTISFYKGNVVYVSCNSFAYLCVIPFFAFLSFGVLFNSN